MQLDYFSLVCLFRKCVVARRSAREDRGMAVMWCLFISTADYLLSADMRPQDYPEIFIFVCVCVCDISFNSTGMQ